MNQSDMAKTPETSVELSYGCTYRQGDRVLVCNYSEGFFANCTVALWNITEVARRFGHYPARLDFSAGFSQYRQNSQNPAAALDLYPYLFQYDPGVAARLNTPPAVNLDHHGIYQNIDFAYYGNLVRTYFNPSERVARLSNRLQDAYKIDLNNVVLVWYRGTDKKSEVSIASPHAYLKQAQAILDANPEFRVWIQTEEQQVRELFSAHFGERCIVINELAPSSVGGNVHLLPPSEASVDRSELAVTLLALVSLGSKARFIVCHTGNIAFWICLYRGHTRSVLQFDRDGILSGPKKVETFWRKLRRLLRW